MSKKSLIFAFVSGVAIGSFATWRMVKTKYEQLAQYEIDSVKDYYARREEERKEKQEYENIAASYTSVTETEETIVDVKEVEQPLGPRMISSDEYGDCEYDLESIIYYADGVCTDDYGDIVEDAEDKLGTEFKSHFGGKNGDSVFVRNDRNRIDYEILRDESTYREVFGIAPPNTVNE